MLAITLPFWARWLVHLFGGGSFPQIPPPASPPPPRRALPPPARTDPGVQQAESRTRDLFRRRGRRTTLLTPGGGAGVTEQAPATRKTLLGQ